MKIMKKILDELTTLCLNEEFYRWDCFTCNNLEFTAEQKEVIEMIENGETIKENQNLQVNRWSTTADKIVRVKNGQCVVLCEVIAGGTDGGGIYDNLNDSMSLNLSESPITFRSQMKEIAYEISRLLGDIDE